MFKKIIVALIGINLMSIGLNIVLNINIGVGPFDSATMLIQDLCSLEKFSNASFMLHMLFAIALISLHKLFNLKVIEIVFSCVSILIITRFVGVYETLIDFNSANLFLFVIGFLVLNLGLYLISISNIIIAPYDKFVVQLASIKNIELGRVRLLCDATLIIIVILLNAFNLSNVVISFGTLFITVGTGFNISLYNKLLKLELK